MDQKFQFWEKIHGKPTETQGVNFQGKSSREKSISRAGHHVTSGGTFSTGLLLGDALIIPQKLKNTQDFMLSIDYLGDCRKL